MAYRFVRATPIDERLAELHNRLASGAIETMEPFGEAMTDSLLDARIDPETGDAVWVEEDYCSPPLAMEREAVLDKYFTDLRIVHEDVDEEAGWAEIAHLPRLWEHTPTVDEPESPA